MKHLTVGEPPAGSGNLERDFEALREWCEALYQNLWLTEFLRERGEEVQA